MAKVKIATLLKKLLNEAGIKDDDKDLLDVLSSPAEIEDRLVTAIENNPNSVTLENAKSHPEISKHFNAKIFNGMDAKILTLAEENGLDTASIDEIKAEKNSYAKLALLNKKLTDSITSKHKTPAEKQALVDEVSRLNKEILDTKTSSNSAIQKAKDEAEKEITEYAINSYLSAQPYANEEIPKEVNVLTARTLLGRELASKEVAIRRENGELKLYNAKNPDLVFLENNKPISFSDLSTSILANNKLLKVTGQASPKAPVKTPQQTPGGKQLDASKYTTALDADIEALTKLQ